MATNKKTRKKLHTHQKITDIPTSWFNTMFPPLINFLDNLKNGFARVNYNKNNTAYVVLIFNNKEHEAYAFIHHWIVLMRLILKLKNINIDFQPFMDFAENLQGRHLEGHLYFDALEITKAKAFVLKILNIFQKEISVQDVNKGRQLLEILFNKNTNKGAVLQNAK